MSVQLCGCGSGDHGAVSVSGSDPGDRSSQGSGRRGDRYVLYVCRSADEDSGADSGTDGNYTGNGGRTADTGRSSARISGFLRGTGSDGA